MISIALFSECIGIGYRYIYDLRRTVLPSGDDTADNLSKYLSTTTIKGQNMLWMYFVNLNIYVRSVGITGTMHQKIKDN